MKGRGKEDISKVGDHNKANVCSGNRKKRECRVMFQVYFIVRLLLQPPKSSRNPSLFSLIKAEMTITLPRGVISWPCAQHCQSKAIAQLHGCSLLDNPHLSLYYTHNESVHCFYICILRVPLNLLAPE